MRGQKVCALLCVGGGMIESDRHGELMMAEDKMDKDLERQYRKNLMVVASIVLIYSIAGGKMAADLSMFGAKLQFSRPDWLEWAMVVVMCFFWWRHNQVSADLRARQRSMALRKMVLPNMVLDDLFQTKNGNPPYLEGDDRWDEVCASRQYHEEFGPISRFYILYTRPFYISVGSGEFYARGDVEPFDGWQTSIHKVHHKLSILFAYVCSYVRYAFKSPEFGDGILPSLVTLAALLAWSFNFVCNLLV
jgi:hypothetical protein